MKVCSADSPIGIFDSGMGGFSVLRELVRALPEERFLYFADQAHLPYGERPLNEIAGFCRGITRFFLARRVKLVIVACNTASAAGLKTLRAEFPQIPFVGMEPAVKPAAEHTRCGKVGVLATAGTLRGEPYAGVVRRFAQGIEVHEQPCTGLAAMIENGASAAELRHALEQWINPLRRAGIDQLALACTHYPLVLPLIQEIAGEDITVIDPAPAIARQVAKVLRERALAAGWEDELATASAGRERQAAVTYYTSSSAAALAAAARRFALPGEVRQAVWQDPSSPVAD